MENIFSKVKHYFRKNKNTNEIIEENKIIKNRCTENDFIDRLAVKSNNENDDNEKLFKIQELFEQGKIKEEEIPKEYYKKLLELYDNQYNKIYSEIEELKK